LPAPSSWKPGTTGTPAPALDLGAHDAHRLGGGADENEAGPGHGLGEGGVLREEPVARMDRLAPGLERGLDDAVHAEIGL